MARKYIRTCPVCHKTFEASRSDKLYCSRNCKSTAYNRRQSAQRSMKSRVLSGGSWQDTLKLRQYSQEAADIVEHVAAVCGKDMADKVLDGYWALLTAFNVDLSPV
jgi:hypothetical protein